MVNKTVEDMAAPAPVKRKLLEKDIQSRCVDWARARGYWARKFSSMTSRSVPDYLFAKMHNDKRLKFVIEFKKPGGVSTKAQEDEQLAMIHAGWMVLVCDSFEQFKWEVERIELTCCTTEKP
jgi:hypothetical protein